MSKKQVKEQALLDSFFNRVTVHDLMQDRRMLLNARNFINECMNTEHMHVESIKFQYPNVITEMVLDNNKSLRDYFLRWKELPLDTTIKIYDFYGGDCFGIAPQVRDLCVMIGYLDICILEMKIADQKKEAVKLEKNLAAEFKNLRNQMVEKVGLEKSFDVDLSDLDDLLDFDTHEVGSSELLETLLNECIKAKPDKEKQIPTETYTTLVFPKKRRTKTYSTKGKRKQK
jgi:hypothetical protein